MASSYDVVVVGGGVQGCSTAYFLAANPDFDGSVAVVERDPTYENTPSARATGGIRQQFSTPENIHIGLFGAYFVKHIEAFLSVDGVAPDIGYREAGYLLLANEIALPIMQGNHRIQREHGATTMMLDRSGLIDHFPWLNTDGFVGGCFGPENEGWCDPYLLLQAFRAKGRALGVTFIKGEITALEHDGTRVSSATLDNGEALHAGAFVNSAGASGAAKLCAKLDVALPIESRKRFTFVFDCQAEMPMTPLTIFPEGLAFRPEGTNFICNLAPTPDNDPECFDYEIDHNDFEERLWPILARHVPAFEAIKLRGAWCCHYDLNTFDENAIVGRVDPYVNLYVLTGFSGHGMQQAPATGRAISELITYGEFRTLDLSRLDLSRVAANNPLLETNCY